jgi:cytochrome c oxidase subunit IV
MHEPVPIRTYLITFVILMVLLILTVALSFIDLGRSASLSLALLIASAKCLLILLFFMHLWQGTKLTRVFAAAGFLWLFILLVLTAGEYLTRNHPPGANPKGEPVYLRSY